METNMTGLEEELPTNISDAARIVKKKMQNKEPPIRKKGNPAKSLHALQCLAKVGLIF